MRDSTENARISCGKYVRELETRFAKLVGVEEAIAVSSGTDAVTLALASLYDKGAKRGDAVIVPALTFPATVHAVVHAGFQPIFVDIERQTLCIDPELISDSMARQAIAIVPVHLMGKMAPMADITYLAMKFGMDVIEDAAEAHGGMFLKKNAGSMGNLGCFSLYIAHIVSSGEGGMITTHSKEVADILRSLRNHGQACSCADCIMKYGKRCEKRFADGGDRRFEFHRIGYSSKMNELEAAIGCGNLDVFDGTLAKRRTNMFYATEKIRAQFGEFLWTIREESYEQVGPHAVPIVVKGDAPFTRFELMRFMEEHDIETRTMFDCIPTTHKGFVGKHRPGDFPVAEFIGRQGLHFGCHQDLNQEHMDYVIDVIAEFINQKEGE